jgi:hypothetical protein
MSAQPLGKTLGKKAQPLPKEEEKKNMLDLCLKLLQGALAIQPTSKKITKKRRKKPARPLPQAAAGCSCNPRL